MNKKGQEGISSVGVLIAILIIAVVAIVVLVYFLPSFRRVSSQLTGLQNQTTTTDQISLKGINEDIKNDPKSYMKNIFDSGNYARYVSICRDRNDPDGRLTNEEIAYLQQKGCVTDDLKSAITKYREMADTASDDLYKKYKTGDNSALDDLKNKYPNSLGARFALALASNKFDDEIGKLCPKDYTGSVITLVYCADAYAYRASKASGDLQTKYNTESIKYYKAVMDNKNIQLTNDRENWFYTYATEESLKKGAVNNLYINIVTTNEKGDTIGNDEFNSESLTKGGNPIDISIDFKGGISIQGNIDLYATAIQNINKVGWISPIECEFRPIPTRDISGEWYETRYSGTGGVVADKEDYCNGINIRFKVENNQIKYKVSWSSNTQ